MYYKDVLPNTKKEPIQTCPLGKKKQVNIRNFSTGARFGSLTNAKLWSQAETRCEFGPQKIQPYCVQQCIPKDQRKFSIMAWACITFQGAEKIAKLREKVDSNKYIEAVRDNLPSTFDSFLGDSCIYH